MASQALAAAREGRENQNQNANVAQPLGPEGAGASRRMWWLFEL